MLLSKYIVLNFYNVDERVSVKDLINVNSTSDLLLNTFGSPDVDVLIQLMEVLEIIYKKADKEDVQFVLCQVF